MKLLLTGVVAIFAMANVLAQPPTIRTGPKKLTDNVFVWSDLHPSGLYATNNLIVITTEGVLVADGQRDAETNRKMVDYIKTLTDRPIKYVVICSEHGDHTGGNAAFPSSATFLSSAQTIKMGDTEIRVVNNGRAHTGSDLEVYLPKEKIFFASEVFSNHIFPSMRTAAPSEWIQTLKKVQAFDAAIFIPGHGAIDEPSNLKAELANFTRALEYVVAEVTRIHKSGATVADGLKQAKWGPYAQWIASDRNAPIAFQRIYDELDGKLK